MKLYKYLNYFAWLSIRRPKLQDKVWIKFHEMKPFALLVLQLSAANYETSRDVLRLMSNIVKLCRSSGFGFTFQYTKEACRLTLKALSGYPDLTWTSGVRVGRDKSGFPWLIPVTLRLLLKSGDNQWLCKLVLTIMSVYRVFPTSPNVSFDTITLPWTGSDCSIPMIRQAIKEILPKRTCGLRPKLILLESSGANKQKSAWNAGWDALAFIFAPNVFIHWCRYMFSMRCGENYVLWVILINLFLGPITWLAQKLKKIDYLNIGRLSIVYDQAGKARVIAITSYWLQLALKPLHQSLFRQLKLLDCDGTFNQTKPLDILISKVESGQQFYSYDLSAATDRLPLSLQEEILNISSRTNLGTLWANLLRSVKWVYDPKGHNTYYQYSVGQPMGAYSSWAMLAVTHHVIVRSCALVAGIRNFSDYAVLGDDIVIANDTVASIYLTTMKRLGVDINLTKSMCSPKFAEFAKTWRGKDYDITPLGPGLILNTLRRSIFYPLLIAEAYKLKLIMTQSGLLKLLKGFKTPFVALWSALGPDVTMWEKDDNELTSRSCILSSVESRDHVLYGIYHTLRGMVIREYRDHNDKLLKHREHFLSQGMYTSTLDIDNWWVEIIERGLRYIGPGYYIYHHELFINSHELDEDAFRAWAFDPKIKDPNYEDMVSKMINLLEIPSISTIDWRNSQEVQQYSRKINYIANCWYFRYTSPVTNSITAQLIRENIVKRLDLLF